jgi:hypothetical protein
MEVACDENKLEKNSTKFNCRRHDRRTGIAREEDRKIKGKIGG